MSCLVQEMKGDAPKAACTAAASWAPLTEEGRSWGCNGKQQHSEGWGVLQASRRRKLTLLHCFPSKNRLV